MEKWRNKVLTLLAANLLTEQKACHSINARRSLAGLLVGWMVARLKYAAALSHQS
jgi:hypothetical protein